MDEIGNGYPTPPIAGNDKPGDYRDFDVEFVPIVSVVNLETVANPHERPLYWHSASQDYYQYDKATGTFNPADNDYVEGKYWTRKHTLICQISLTSPFSIHVLSDTALE